MIADVGEGAALCADPRTGDGPDPREVAAVVAALAVLAARRVRPHAAPAGGAWSAPVRLLRRPLRPGPGAWSAASRGTR